MFFKKKVPQALPTKAEHRAVIKQDGIESIEALIKLIPEQKDEPADADHDIVLSNIIGLIEEYCDLAQLVWRENESPLEYLNSAKIWYLDHLLPHIKSKPYKIEYYPGNWEYIYTMLWLSGFHPEKLFESNDLIEFPFYKYQRVFAYKILGWDIDGTIEREASELLEISTDFLSNNFRDLLHLVKSNPKDADFEGIVKRLSDGWEKREKNRGYVQLPAFMGSDESNWLNVDFYLAAVLKKLEWDGEANHKFMW